MKISDLVVEGQDKDAKPTHKVTVTFSEPNNATVSKRNDIRTQKATAQADDKDSAIERIKKHYTKAGYKVHDIKHDGLKEEIEEIVELSKKTLGAYTKQAAVGLALSGIGIGRSDNTAPHAKTMTKRIAGINRATDKLTKEEAELDEALSDAARELVVHGDNDSHLFHSSREPIIANLKQKVAKGTYDHEKAKKLWSHHADRTAQSYAKEHGDSKTPWHKQFTTADRKQAASHFADQARDEHLNEEQLDEELFTGGRSYHPTLSGKLDRLRSIHKKLASSGYTTNSSKHLSTPKYEIDHMGHKEVTYRKPGQSDVTVNHGGYAKGGPEFYVGARKESTKKSNLPEESSLDEDQLDENQKYDYGVCLTKGTTVGARQHTIINVKAKDSDEAEKLAREEHIKKFPHAQHKDFHVAKISNYGKSKEE